MLTRRALVLAGLAVLAGCSVSDPAIVGQIPATATPTPPAPLPGAADGAAAELDAARHLAALTSSPWAGADAARWGGLVTVRVDHWKVLASTDPWTRAATTASPPAVTGEAVATREAGLAAADSALGTLRDAHRARALATAGVGAALWGSLTASAELSRIALTTVIDGWTPADTTRTVAVTSDPDALEGLVARYHEAVFALSSVIGFLGPSHAWRATLRTMLETVRTERDALVAVVRAAGGTPSPQAGAYSLPQTSGDAAAKAVVATAQRACATAAGGWVASAATASRDRAVTALVTAATWGTPLGLGGAAWPGFGD